MTLTQRFLLLLLTVLSNFSILPSQADSPGANQIADEARAELIAQMNEDIARDRAAHPRLAAMQEEMLKAHLSGDQRKLHEAMASYMNELSVLTPYAAEFKSQSQIWRRSSEIQKEIDAARQAGKFAEARSKEKIQHATLSGLAAPGYVK